MPRKAKSTPDIPEPDIVASAEQALAHAEGEIVLKETTVAILTEDRVAVTQMFNEFTGRMDRFNAAGDRL